MKIPTISGSAWMLLTTCLLAAALHAETTIERVEYFIGEDPGRGHATPLAVPAGATTLDSALKFPAGSLPSDRRVQVTIRALDSEGTWSPPEVITIVRPFLDEEGDSLLADVVYGFGDTASQVFSLDAGQSEATTTLSFPTTSGPSGESGMLWARATRSDGISGPPAVAATLPPVVDRFAGQAITGVGTWNYAILNGQTVVTNGTLTRSGESLTGIDFSGLIPSVQYTLVITPVAIGGQFPLPRIGTSVDMKSDYQFWQNLHFSAAEQANASLSGPDADPLQSGMTNLERFIVGIGPTDPPRPLRLAIEETGDAGSPAPVVRFERSKLAAMANYLVEQSPDLVNWHPASIIGQDIENVGAASETVTLRPELLKPSDTPAMFYRLAFTLNTP